jgi:hypothetical protein
MVADFMRRRALQLYPQLAQAVPPKPLGRSRETPLRVGAPPYLVQNCFWDSHRADCARRQLDARDPSGVIGPITARGNCLDPLYADGARLWFDPAIAAQHGDLVLIQFEFPDQSERFELGFMAKILVEFADEYWLAFNTGMFPLADIKILAVEVRDPRRHQSLDVFEPRGLFHAARVQGGSARENPITQVGAEKPHLFRDGGS